MYYTFGLANGLETLVALSKPYAFENKIFDEKSLKSAYLKFLANYQPSIPYPSESPVEFVRDIKLVELLTSFFQIKSLLNDKDQHKVIAQASEELLNRISYMRLSFEEMKKLQPEFAQLFELAINYVFCAGSKQAGGGSSSSALGVMWSAYRETWTTTDVLEFYVHELTHNLVFLDECRFRHYKDYAAISEKKNYVKSAILAIDRPLDKVVHSLMVATEVLLFREKVIGHFESPQLHPRSEIMIQKALVCIESIDGLKNINDLITPRALELVGRCRILINEIASKFKKEGKLDKQYEEPKFQSFPVAV